MRRGRGASGFALAEYVNDRPYVASSFLSVAMRDGLQERDGRDLQGAPGARRVGDPARGLAAGRARAWRRGHSCAACSSRSATSRVTPSRSTSPGGDSRYVGLRLTGELRLADLLNHLYVLLPVLDDDKHYWVDEAEIEKLMRRGEGWLAAHPERDLIVRRYLKQQRQLSFPALAQLDEALPRSPPTRHEGEQALEERVSLRDQRLGTGARPCSRPPARGASSTSAAGRARCWSGCVRDGYDEVVGVDVSIRALEQAARRLKLDVMPDAQRERIKLLQSPLTYRDRRLTGYDAAVLVEVIEHLDPPRLAAAEQQRVRRPRGRRRLSSPRPTPSTTSRWETLPAGRFRHPDHRFEWTRAEFARLERAASPTGTATRVRYLPIGPEDPEVGPPTQMAVFER